MLHAASRRSLAPCTCRLISTSSSPLAPYHYTSLRTTRSLLPIAGVDAPKFLQGLISNDVHKLGTPGTKEERALFAAILKADGRILHDIFLYPSTHAEPPAYFIDHSSLSTPALRTYLKRHILRSKVKLALTATDESEILTAWRTEEDATVQEVQEAEAWLKEQTAGEDSRAPGMGWRWPAKVDAKPPPEHLFKLSTPAQHHFHRLLHAVPEGPLDWPQLPLEGNLELMGGVDYKKGCYVGQELTARTKHKGVVRKRGVVVRLWREGEETPDTLLPPHLGPLTPYPDLFPLPAPFSSLTPLASLSPRTRPSGKLGTSLPLINRVGQASSLAFASLRLEQIEGADEGAVFVVKPKVVDEGELGEREGVESGGEEEGGRWLARAWIPEWVREKLDEGKGE